MRAHKLGVLLLGGWAVLSISACGFGYYKALSQPAGPSSEIQQATEFKVRPLDYSAVKYSDLGYENEAQMKEEFVNFQTDFADNFKDMWKTEGVPPKKIVMVSADQPVQEGIVVKTVVDRIQLNWNAWSNNADDFYVTITFTDAASGKQLFSGKFLVKNTAFTMGLVGAAMGTRLNNAAYNIDWLLVKIMSGGMAQPAEY